MIKFSRYTRNQLISKFSVDSDVAFVSYARFTAYTLLVTLATLIMFELPCRHEKIHKFGHYLAKQVNLQEIFSTQIYVLKGLLLV